MPPSRFLIPLMLLAGCTGDYSPDTYSTRAVQQANPVQQGVIIGAREVAISSDGNAGAAAGAAAGGIIGAATPGTSMTSALAGVGGGLIGGLFGSATERVVNDNRGTEYIVRKTNGELVNVTQRDVPPLPIGERVLVIAGAQARIVRDYTVPGAAAPAGAAPAPVEAPVRADPPAAGAAPSGQGATPPPGTPQPPTEAPTRSELPPAAPASADAPPSPRVPLVPPEAPLSL
jgi:outer membrane lipoprotein SlyB